jgi:uncharacterized protein DUF997
MSPSPDRPGKEQQLLRHARRESLVVMAVWAFALAWSTVCGYVLGYNPHREVGLILGMPDWVFWAVVLPWGLILLFSAWFCFAFMADDDLGRDPEEKRPTESGHD